LSTHIIDRDVRRVVLCAVALGAGVALLTTAATAGTGQMKGGTLRIATPRDVTVDPALPGGPPEWMIAFATCAKLYSHPDKPAPAGATVIPEVAQGFPMVSRDGKTQTIELKRTYRFHTGQPVRAANFVAAFNRDADPKLGSATADYLHEIVGADAVIDGKAKTIAGVRALGPYALQIRTTRPLGDLAARLTMPYFCPIATNTPAAETDDPLGSGPYYVASRVRNRQVVLERNRFYRGSRPANADQIVWTISAPGACRAAVERDEVDDCFALPPTAYQEIAAKYGINKGRFFFNPRLSTFFFAFNHDRPAFKGPGQIPLKKAINWAIDRPALVRAAGYLGGKRTDQILPPAMGRGASIYPLGGVTQRSLAKARALLAKAKLKPKTLVLYAGTTGTFGVDPILAQIFQFNLKRLGIDVDVRFFPHPTQFGKAGTRGEPFDVVIGGWGTDYADGNGFFGPLLNGANIREAGNANAAYFDRPRYNREIERINRLTGEARRRAAWAELDVDMMRNDPPWAPFMNGVRRDFISESFGCFFYHPVIELDLAAACKK
jgi:peptide/nickel transport system substrate-binding protein